MTSSFCKRCVFGVHTDTDAVAFSKTIHFQQRFQKDPFSMKTLSVFEHISVDRRAKRIHINAFSNKNASVWTGP